MSETNKKAYPIKVDVGQLFETATADWLALYTRRVYREGTGPISGGASPDATGDSTDPSSELVRDSVRGSEDGERTYLQTTVPSRGLTDPSVRNDPSPEKSQNPNSKCRS